MGPFGRLIIVGGILIAIAWIIRPHDPPVRIVEHPYANFSFAPTARSAYSVKATYNERVARERGGLNDDTATLYERGLTHIRNKHLNVGSYTVGQVIDDERSREKQRADDAERVRRAEEARHQAKVEAEQRRVAAEERHFVHGSPSCLIIDDRTIHSVSEEYHWSIVGKVKNTCSRDFSYVAVHVKFYDSAGNVENSGLTNMNNLGAGETWAFKKMVYENTSPGGKWAVEEVTGY